MIRTNKVLLVITDGIGHKPRARKNAFLAAAKPAYERLFKETKTALLATHGLSVGLPKGQMGNSEVGHLTLGGGRILYQDLVKIGKAIEDGSLRENKALIETLEKSDRIHLVGLLSDGGVHSHIDHILGMAKICEEAGKDVFLHLFTDGRDVSPTSSQLYLDDIRYALNDRVKLCSIGGRYYGMDRDNRWDRVKRAYEAIVLGKHSLDSKFECADSYIPDSHERGITDEFIEPVSAPTYNGMLDGDAVIMLNFRSDRMREITQLIGDPNFMPIEVEKRQVHLTTMTEYNAAFTFPILFPKDNLTNTLCETISRAGLRQFHTAETEKYAHVTFFFNGGREEPYENEDRALIPSPKVATYDTQPEMSADPVGEMVLSAIGKDYDFIVVNFANGDMVGHTGNYEAAIKAVEAVDRNLDHITKAAEKAGYQYIITSDHGNCEEMEDERGNMLTNHTVGDVWCFVKSNGGEKVGRGGLSNVAPTILKMLGLEIPAEMDKTLFDLPPFDAERDDLENTERKNNAI
ncbi:MAG: 2,3-bisphosphoglycerate-independent phosphoglycerate mutase [Helicobacteraceae bacterium]|jgi:2,3-bisphosphoglycerate-independent phosphoglycerate mutase|nr:2,3-bisphosphoglycerate-independent phosphoglycerate mutase [Helicobacteraceae bacterium]